MSKPGLTRSFTTDKVGEAINGLMAGISPKKLAFKLNIARDDLYRLKREWPLFCGWVNEYNRSEDD